MKPLDDETLQRYFDGELSEGEAQAVEVALAGDERAALHLEGLEGLSGLLRDTFEARTPVPDADALFARVTAATRHTAQPAQVAAEGARVVPLPTRAVRRAPVVPVLASLAVAAAALLVFLGPRAAREAAITPQAQLGSPAPSGSQIDDVDFGGSTGTVFEVDNEGVSAAVVWISDDEESTP
jgi:anti-sigma factor RsiW